MAKKNKPLNVGGFMQEVKNNQPTKNEEFPEKNKEVTVPESTQSSVVDTKVTQRNIKQVFKVDAQSSTDLMMIKAINRIDVQDVVFTAVQEFLAKYYTRGLGLSNDAIERITEITEKYDV